MTLEERYTEAQRIHEEEKRLSNAYVKIDLLKREATIKIPYEVRDLLERNEQKIEFIHECQKSKDPRKNCRFPVGSTLVKDIDALIEDIDNVKDTFLNQQLNLETTTLMEQRLQLIFHRFMTDKNSYTKLI